MRFILPLLFLSNFIFGQNLTPKKYEDSSRWGYEDEKGLMIIAYDFLEANPFVGNYAIVKKKYGYGVIDKKGKLIFRCNYDKIDLWQNGIFIMHWKNNNTFYIGLANENKKLNSRYQKATFFYENELRVYSTFGTTIISSEGVVKYIEDTNDIIWIQDYLMIFKEKWGCIDSDDKLIVPFEYDTIMFSQHLVEENLHSCIAKKNDKWYKLNLNKNPIGIEEYDALEYLKDGKILFKKKNEYGFIKMDGTIMNSSSWENILSDKRKIHNGGDWSMYSVHNKYGIFDTDYKPLIPPIYKKLYPVHRSEFFIAQKNGLFGLLNLENRVIIDFKYESLFYDYRTGLNAVKNGKLGIIDFEEKIIIPFEYEKNMNKYPPNDWWSGEFVQLPTGNLVIQKNGKTGVIDLNNNILIPFEYEMILGFNIQRKYFQVKENGKWGILNSKNEWVISPEFDKFYFMTYDRLESYQSYNENKISLGSELGMNRIAGDSPPPRAYNVFLAQKDGKKTAFNLNGKQLLPLDDYSEYSKVLYYKTDTLIHAIGGYHNGIVDINGKVWIDFKYELIGYHTWDIFLVKEDNKYGLIHKDKTILQPIEYDEIKGQKVLKDGKYGILNRDRKSFLLEIVYDEIEIKENSNYPNDKP